MGITYFLKEMSYYRKLGKGNLRRMVLKFFLAKTFLSSFVNSKSYNFLYSHLIKSKINTIKPYILQIENTNLCNARCIMCPHIIMKRKTKIMKQEEFIKICENVLPYEEINLFVITGFGEPFIDKGIFKKIEWLNENYPKIDIDIYTNASLLDRESSDNLLKLKTHKINFSINGTDKTYKHIMGLNYEQTKKNIIYFLKKKSSLKKEYPLTNISLMILKENKEEIEKVIKFWENKVDSVMAYAPSDWAGSLKNASILSKSPFKYKRWPCMALWNSIMVDVNGEVIMCCRDYESKVKFGNLLKENIKTIRNSKKFKELLKKQERGNFNTPICHKCDNNFDSSLNWWN